MQMISGTPWHFQNLTYFRSKQPGNKRRQAPSQAVVFFFCYCEEKLRGGKILDERIGGRRVAEIYLGRKLAKGEVVHHINEQPWDNRIENLIVFKDREAHMVMHSNPSRMSTTIATGRGKKKYRKQVTYHLGKYNKNIILDSDIVLYGPKCADLKKKRFERLKEKTKKDFGVL